MKPVYTHQNRAIVENARNVLTVNGIESTIKNAYAGGGLGELSAFDTWPEVWVEDSDYPKAQSLIEDLMRQTEQPDWQCENCQERNASSFDYCWQCQRERPAG